MPLSAKLDNLVIKSFSKTLEVNLPIIETLGKLGKSQFNENIKIGDEIDFIMPPEVTLSKYTGTLSGHQKLTNTNIKIAVNQAWDYDYSIDDTDAARINAMPNDKGTVFVTDAVKNVTEKFTMKRELSIAALYSQAGFNMNASSIYNSTGYTTPTNPIALTPDNIKMFFHKMKAYMKNGQTIDGVPRSSWIENKMLAFIPGDMEALLVGTGDLIFTPKGIETQINGEIGKYAGWRIITTNVISADGSGNFHPVFGVEGETIGTIMQKNLTSEKLRDLSSFSDIYRGLGIFGVGVARRDKLGTASVSISFS